MRKSADAASLVHDLQPHTKSSTTATIACSMNNASHALYCMFTTFVLQATTAAVATRPALLHSCLWFSGDFLAELILKKEPATYL